MKLEITERTLPLAICQISTDNSLVSQHETIEDIVAEGDKVWARVTFTGTHTGEQDFFGVTSAPTGKKITSRAVDIWRIVDGKMAEGCLSYPGGPTSKTKFLRGTS